jgi:hypothetical protein
MGTTPRKIQGRLSDTSGDGAHAVSEVSDRLGFTPDERKLLFDLYDQYQVAASSAGFIEPDMYDELDDLRLLDTEPMPRIQE